MFQAEESLLIGSGGFAADEMDAVACGICEGLPDAAEFRGGLEVTVERRLGPAHRGAFVRLGDAYFWRARRESNVIRAVIQAAAAGGDEYVDECAGFAIVSEDRIISDSAAGDVEMAVGAEGKSARTI